MTRQDIDLDCYFEMDLQKNLVKALKKSLRWEKKEKEIKSYNSIQMN